jgi:hypothetical protein
MDRVTQKTSVFEIHLKGSGVRPEDIPLKTLAQILSAVQRMTSGSDASRWDKAEEEENALRLLRINRGSTTLPIYVPAKDSAIHQLKYAQSVIESPESLGESDYLLGCLKDLSAASRVLECPIVVKRPGIHGEILTTINADTYNNITKSVFVHGTTSLVGRVERVGNATEAHCSLRTKSQDRMIYCKIGNIDLARQLGQLLYEEVQVHGEAMWIKSSWKIVDFKITEVVKRTKGTISEMIEALRKAGGDGWDDIDDPVAYIEEVTG